MTESDRELIRLLTESNKELAKSVLGVHVVAAETKTAMVGMAKRQEDFINAHASYVRANDARAEEHADAIEKTSLQVHEWKSQQKLVLAVASFLGLGGLVAIVSKLSGH